MFSEVTKALITVDPGIEGGDYTGVCAICNVRGTEYTGTGTARDVKKAIAFALQDLANQLLKRE